MVKYRSGGGQLSEAEFYGKLMLEYKGLSANSWTNIYSTACIEDKIGRMN